MGEEGEGADPYILIWISRLGAAAMRAEKVRKLQGAEGD